ncbi:unnamed protein product [Amoebophrya sp. A25]|nr:unnamed protein product [Amoebophrya sp. A25]|eukprot:GSA25T00009052001.1
MRSDQYDAGDSDQSSVMTLQGQERTVRRGWRHLSFGFLSLWLRLYSRIYTTFWAYETFVILAGLILVPSSKYVPISGPRRGGGDVDEHAGTTLAGTPVTTPGPTSRHPGLTFPTEWAAWVFFAIFVFTLSLTKNLVKRAAKPRKFKEMKCRLILLCFLCIGHLIYDAYYWTGRFVLQSSVPARQVPVGPHGERTSTSQIDRDWSDYYLQKILSRSPLQPMERRQSLSDILPLPANFRVYEEQLREVAGNAVGLAGNAVLQLRGFLAGTPGGAPTSTASAGGGGGGGGGGGPPRASSGMGAGGLLESGLAPPGGGRGQAVGGADLPEQTSEVSWFAVHEKFLFPFHAQILVAPVTQAYHFLSNGENLHTPNSITELVSAAGFFWHLLFVSSAVSTSVTLLVLLLACCALCGDDVRSQAGTPGTNSASGARAGNHRASAYNNYGRSTQGNRPGVLSRAPSIHRSGQTEQLLAQQPLSEYPKV